MSRLVKAPLADTPSLHIDRLIVATNRGPVEYYVTKDATLQSRRGSGGVLTALIEANSQVEMSWVAMAMTEGDRLAVKKMQMHGGHLASPIHGQRVQLHYASISQPAYRKYYNTISNQLLWFLQHYLSNPAEDSTTKKRLQDAWEQGYRVANQAIADAVLAEIENEPTKTTVVMLHDYHLYLAPAMIRRHHPTLLLQQFIHIPWPDIRCWQFLPGNIAREIYQGLLGNDLLGLQTERDVHNFLDGARTLLEGAEVDFEEGMICWQGHRALVRAYPISISVTGERAIVNSAAGKRAAESIKPLLGEQTILRVDRIEPTKNIVRGFQAYGRLLEDHTELRGKVQFLALLVPSRQSLPAYKRYTAEVMKMIAAVNQRYGTADWQPIIALCGNDRTRALAALQFYDVLLVNSIIDGMNLVAKEGPAVNQTAGVLVLSRTVGAFQQLGKVCVPTSPIDVEETAQALYQALTMPAEERHRKALLARRIVERQDLAAWMARQIGDMNAILDRSG